MTSTIRLTCDAYYCRERLHVAVSEEYGPWVGEDARALLAAAAAAGWRAEIDALGYALHYCPAHASGHSECTCGLPHDPARISCEAYDRASTADEQLLSYAL